MRGQNLLIGLVVAVMVLACVVPVAAQRPAPDETPASKPVTLDLKNVPLADAIRQVVAATDIPVVIAGELPAEPRVTMRLKNTDPLYALQALATAGGLFFQAPAEERSPEGGRRLSGPVLLSTEYPTGFSGGPRPGRTYPSASQTAALPTAVPIPANIAVDLNVKDTPFREAIDQLAKQIPPTDRVRIVVDESVPKELRVTARLSKMPLNWVIDSLVQQASLTYGVQDEPDPRFRADLEARVRDGLMSTLDMQSQLANAPRLHTVYIVPKPELHVSGSAGGASAGPM